MEVVKSGLFRAAYFMYANTSVGYYYHSHNLANAEKKFKSIEQKAHSKEVSFTYGNVQLHVIPFCLDNYAYVIVDLLCNSAIVVDPGDATPVLEFFERNPNFQPIAILCTHKHWDHCAGNGELLERYPEIEIFASEDDGAYLSNRTFRDTEELHFHQAFTSAKVVAYEMPGHTVGHALYCVTPLPTHHSSGDENTIKASLESETELSVQRDLNDSFSNLQVYQYEKVIPRIICEETFKTNGSEANSESKSIKSQSLLFTGDCVFLNGIGNMFECPSVVMAATLQRIIDIFPENTLVLPGHEYTQTMVRFTLQEVDPENPVLKQRLDTILRQRAENLPTVPAELGIEKQCNPFLRTSYFSLHHKEFLKRSSSEIVEILAEKKAKFTKELNAKSSSKSNSANSIS